MGILLLATALAGGPAACSRDEPAEGPRPAARVPGPAASPQTADSDRTVVLAADAWPPYNCAADDTIEGLLIEIARAALEPQGYRVEYRVVPWQRALRGTMAGDYDGAVAPSEIECVGCIFPQQPLYQNVPCFFVRRGNPWRYRGADDLQGVTLGAVAGYDYAPWLNDYIAVRAGRLEDVQLVAGDYPLRQNLRKLLAGRIDVLVGNAGTVRYVARGLGILGELEQAGCDTTLGPCYIAFTPARERSRLLAAQLDAGVRTLRASGALDRILARYGLDEAAAGHGKAAPRP